jgi:hypothetical protein
MSIFRTMVQVAMLPMFYARQALPLRRAVALQLIHDHHTGDALAPFEELAEEFLCGGLSPAALDQDIEEIAVLIRRTPEIVVLPLHGQKDFAELPCIAG